MNKIVGFLGVLAMVAAAPMARADFQISVNGTTCITVVSGSPNGSATCGIVTPVAGVTITNLSVTGNQLASVSQQLGSTLSIQNTTSSAATLDIYLADSGFTSPTIPPAITIQDVSGATINGTTGTNSFTLTSCVDQSNGLVPPSGTNWVATMVESGTKPGSGSGLNSFPVSHSAPYCSTSSTMKPRVSARMLVR